MSLIPPQYLNAVLSIEIENKQQKGEIKKRSIATGFLVGKEIYKKKTHHEHILTMPDTYIGSVEKKTEEMWIFDTETKKMIKKIVENK